MKVEPKLYKRVFVWSWALRLFHWTFAFSITTLILTGLYIHDPQVTTTWSEFRPSYLIATMRYLHFIAGYFFIAAVILRVYLLFFGNKYERLRDFLPINRENIQSLKKGLKFYLYLTDEHEYRAGHTVLAGITYFFVFLAAIVMILSGLYILYSEMSIIKKIGTFFFGTVQMARLVHYLLMWFFILFILIHLYIAIWNDLKSPEGLISSIFSGSKFLPDNVIKKEVKN